MEATKQVAMAIQILKDCNVEWEDDDVVTVILLLEEALVILTGTT